MLTILAALWVDPGSISYGDHYGMLQWAPPSWILQCIMVRIHENQDD